MTGSGCQQQVVVSHGSELTTTTAATTTADRWRDRDQGEGHALKVLHDDLVRRDVHLRARRVARVVLRREPERGGRGEARRRQLRRAVHVDVVVVVEVRERGHGAAGGDGSVWGGEEGGWLIPAGTSDHSHGEMTYERTAAGTCQR